MMTHVMLFSSRLRVSYENCPLFYPLAMLPRRWTASTAQTRGNSQMPRLQVPTKVQILAHFSRLRPYHRENTGSRPITEVKPCRAGLVLGWVTAWEYPVL